MGRAGDPPTNSFYWFFPLLNSSLATLRILMVLGSTRSNRVGSKVAAHVAASVKARGHLLTTLDPRDSHDGFFMRLMEKAYFHYKEGEEVPPPLAAAAEDVRAADAFLVVTPEFNHTIAPGLTNAMNYFGGSLYRHRKIDFEFFKPYNSNTSKNNNN